MNPVPWCNTCQQQIPGTDTYPECQVHPDVTPLWRNANGDLCERWVVGRALWQYAADVYLPVGQDPERYVQEHTDEINWEPPTGYSEDTELMVVGLYGG